MKILITGICGFAGSSIARELRLLSGDLEIFGIDNFSRPGSERNRTALRDEGFPTQHGDIRLASDLESLPRVDWVIDAAANPSVLAGISSGSSSRQLLEHNLGGTINLLEWCKSHGAGFLLLSTSRVYSVAALDSVRLQAVDGRFVPEPGQTYPNGISEHGVAESCSTAAPVSLYGATKVASESLALEYGEAFDLPVWINRCGVLAGAGQFGRPDQGILAFWIHSFFEQAPLRFVGFEGTGAQVRDFLHPRDVAGLLIRQLNEPARPVPRIQNLGGGTSNSSSLAGIHAWCEQRFGRKHPVGSDPRTRRYDVPWLIMNSNLAKHSWDWTPRVPLHEICEEIAKHAEANPQWLGLSASNQAQS